MMASPLDVTAGPDNLPVAPIPSATVCGWTNSYLLASPSLSVGIVPAIGRIVLLGTTPTNNLLHLPEAHRGVEPSTNQAAPWLNYGGDWLWPVSQKHWPRFQNGDWPPSLLLDGRPWSGRAWLNADGVQCCLLQQEYPAPLNLKVTRLIKLPTNTTTVSIEQRVECLAETQIPVTLWNISQVAAPSHLLFPLTQDSSLEPPYLLMMGTPPEEDTLAECDKTAVFDTSNPVETKIGSYATNSWIAALFPNGQLLLETASPSSKKQANYPDGGSSLEMYSNKGLGYSEIENLSPEILLKPGEILANEIRISLHKLSPLPATPCEIAQTITPLLAFPPESK